MSTAVIDNITNRDTERLTAFMSRVENDVPVDNISVDLPTFSELWKSKKIIDGGRQSFITLDTARNSTINSFSGYDVFDTSPQDTVRPALFAYINYGGTATISWEEMRETANSDVRTFDMVAHKRKNAVASLKDRVNSDMYIAVPAAADILSLPNIITTGTLGGINGAVETWWQAQETTAVGAFTANGITNMRTLWNDITRQGQGSPSMTMTTQAIFEAYEAEIDPDVRYSSSDKLSRGATMLEWKGKPIMFDNDCPAGELYMINYDHMWLYVDTDGQITFDKFIEPANQKVYTAKLVFRGQLVCNNRRGLGRLTGIS